jgi:trigger factor
VFELTNKEVLDTQEALLTLEVDEGAVAKAKQKAARDIARQIDIPGFRKGKAPYNIVVQRVGEETILQEAADELLEEIYPEALERAEIEPYGPGSIEEMTLSPMVFKVRVPLAPEIDLGDYQSLRLEPEEVEVTERELSHALRQVREDQAVLEPVERPIEWGDRVTLAHLTGEVDGEDIIHEHDVDVVMEEGEDFFTPGFLEALVGMEMGEEKVFTLTLSEDFSEPSLQGQEVQFTVEIDQVQSREAPELDDALASAVGNYETLDELKEDLRQRLKAHKEDQAHEAYRAELVQTLVEGSEVRYPPILEEKELDLLLEQFKQDTAQRSGIDWEDLLRLQGTTEDQIREQLRPQAVERLTRALVLSEFAREIDVSLSDEDVLREMRQILTSVGVTDESVQERFGVDSKMGQDIRASLLGRKTVDALERLAQGKPLEEPAEEAEEKVVYQPEEGGEVETPEEAEEATAWEPATEEEVEESVRQETEELESD